MENNTFDDIYYFVTRMSQGIHILESFCCNYSIRDNILEFLNKNGWLVNSDYEKNWDIFNSLSSLLLLSTTMIVGQNKELLETNKDIFSYKKFAKRDIDGNDWFDNAQEFLWPQMKKNTPQPLTSIMSTIVDDNKKEPYQYIKKIRNAFEHGEFYIKNLKTCLCHISNSKDNSKIFDAKCLTPSICYFMHSIFGNENKVNFGCFGDIIQQQEIQFKNQKEIEVYLKNLIYRNYKIGNLKNPHIYDGDNISIERYLTQPLNFPEKESIDVRRKNFNDRISEFVENENNISTNDQYISPSMIDFIISDIKKIDNFYQLDIHQQKQIIFQYIETVYSLQYKIEDLSYLFCDIIIHLQYGSYASIIDRIESYNKYFKKLSPTQIDMYITLLKISYVNYIIQNSLLNSTIIESFNLDLIYIDYNEEYERRLNKIKEKYPGQSLTYYNNFIKLDIIRNSMSHSGRLSIKLLTDKDRNTDLEFVFIDKKSKWDKNTPKIKVYGMASDFNELYKQIKLNLFKNLSIENNKQK